MHELPAINDKTVKTVSTIDFGGKIVELRITFKDGSALIADSQEGFIRVRMETPAPPAIVTARSEWPGE